MQMNTSSLSRNALLNTIKQVASIVFPLLSFSYASRVVGADGIGVYSFVQSIISYMLLIASIGITNYAVREGAKLRDDHKRLELFCNQVYSINITFTVLAYLVLLFLLLTWPRLNEYKSAVLIQCTAIIVTTLGADWINTIFEDYLYLTIRYIIVQLLSLVFLILFVNSADDLVYYIIICTFSSVGGLLFNIVYIRKRLRLRFTLKMNFKVHLIPLLVLFFNSIASVIYLNSDITMLNIYLNDNKVGIYTVSSKVYSVLKTLINGIIYVTIPRFSFYLGNGQKSVYETSLNTVKSVILMLTFPTTVGLWFLSGDILNIFAGTGYEEGINVIKILSLAFPFAVGSCFYSYAVLIPNGLEKKFMLSTSVAAIMNVSLNLYFIPAYGISGAAITTVLAEILVFLITHYYSAKTVQINNEVREYMGYFSGSVLVALVCFFITKSFDAILARLLLSFLCSIILYFIIQILFKNKAILSLAKNISK